MSLANSRENFASSVAAGPRSAASTKLLNNDGWHDTLLDTHKRVNLTHRADDANQH
jgi:hypothetical protein